MERHDFDIPLSFRHRIIFTRDAFVSGNAALKDVMTEGGGRRAAVFIEQAVAVAWGDLEAEIAAYFRESEIELVGISIRVGGEECKADDQLVKHVWSEIDRCHIDRHSYVIVIGGGAFLDAVGFAVSTAHRGVRLVRFPTTTLSQDDSGVGVKNAYNAFNKKNWIGTFSVPFAVINDFKLLESQEQSTKIAGLAEAVKVALVKDKDFFEWIEKNVEKLVSGDQAAFEECVKRSALMHAQHIAYSGDAFEAGSSRPLDFGHWAAHKIEALTDYQYSHAEAVGVGLALDTVYSEKKGYLSQAEAWRILAVLRGLGLEIYCPALDFKNAAGERLVISGLDEFREHLGGELTVLLLDGLGSGIDIHEFDLDLIAESIEALNKYDK